MKKHNAIYRGAAIPLFCLAVLFASCDTPVEPDSGASPGTETALQAGKASVNFTIKNGAARTVLPDLSDVDFGELSYTITGNGPSEVLNEDFSGSGTTLTLEPGAWTFTLYAENTEKDISLIAGAEVTLAANQSNEVVFALRPPRQGTGAVNISFEYPAYAGITRVEVDGGIPDAALVINPESGTGSYKAADIPADDYFTTFSFYSGDTLAAVLSETIQVRGGFTSKKTISLSPDNLKNVIKPAGDTLADKLRWIADNVRDNTSYFVEVTANEAIAPTRLEYGKSGVSITLTGIGEERIISPSETGEPALDFNMFSVGSGVTLTLENNIILSGADLTHNLVYLPYGSEGGALVLNDGAKITGNIYSRDGLVNAEGGTFTMNGGEITGNTSGYGVAIRYATIMTMNGGKISGNIGGVYVYEGTFTMNGGKITENIYSDGGGVYLHDGTFIMNDGEISGNTTNATGYNGNYGGNGGGVGGWNSTFTMNGGKISGNTAYNNGGGVSMVGTFTMNGGKISGNTAYNNGGGVFMSGTFTMNGGEISGNTARRQNIGEIISRGNGGGVFIQYSSNFIKTSGVISGNETAEPPANNANSGMGHAVYWDGMAFYQNSTLGADDSISTEDVITNWEHPEVKTIEIGNWNSGYLSMPTTAQYFKFTASATTHFTHIKLGSLMGTDWFMYDSAFQPISSSNLEIGREYYIVVWGRSGSYEIAVTTSETPPN